MEPLTGIEPVTHALQVRCSTTELQRPVDMERSECTSVAYPAGRSSSTEERRLELQRLMDKLYTKKRTLRPSFCCFFIRRILATAPCDAGDDHLSRPAIAHGLKRRGRGDYGTIAYFPPPKSSLLHQEFADLVGPGHGRLGNV